MLKILVSRIFADNPAGPGTLHRGPQQDRQAGGQRGGGEEAAGDGGGQVGTQQSTWRR